MADLGIFPLSKLVRSSVHSENMPLAVFHVVSVTPGEGRDSYFNIITVKVDEILCGDTSYKDEEIKLYASPTKMSQIGYSFPDQLVGQRYVGFIDRRETNGVYPYMAFYITDNDLLVSPFGCSAEEAKKLKFYAPEGTENNPDQCYAYTGRTLNYFRGEVNRYVKEANDYWASVSASSSEQ